MELPDESPKLQKSTLFNLFVEHVKIESLQYSFDDLKKLNPHLQNYDLFDEKYHEIIEKKKVQGLSLRKSFTYCDKGSIITYIYFEKLN